MPYLAFVARLYHGVEATSCQAERNFSALANLIGDLRSNMLASKVERMMFIRLNKHMVDEVRDLDATKAKARARVAKSAKQSTTAQQERANMVVDVSLLISRFFFFFFLFLYDDDVQVFNYAQKNKISCWRLTGEQLLWSRRGEFV